MKVFMLMAGSGPLMILTSHTSIEEPEMLEKLASKGIDKFLAYEVPFDLAKARYGGHFTVVANDLHETDDLRVLDYNRCQPWKVKRRLVVRSRRRPLAAYPSCLAPEGMQRRHPKRR